MVRRPSSRLTEGRETSIPEIQRPTIRNLETVPPNFAPREWVDNVMHTTHGKTRVRIPEKGHLNERLMERGKAKRASLEKIAEGRAKLY
jgi:hypothetical protein